MPPKKKKKKKPPSPPRRLETPFSFLRIRNCGGLFFHTSANDKPKKRCKGLHSLMEEKLFPNFRDTFDSTPAQIAKSKSKAKGRRPCRGKDEARKHGILVDRQIRQWVDISRRTRKTKAAQDKLDKFDESTKNLITAFTQTWRWKPAYANGVVGIAEKKIATAFDLLCTNEKDELVLVEIKTGFDHYWALTNGQTLEPKELSHIPSSAKTHAMIQAAMTARYYRKTHEEPKLKHVYVVREHAGGVERILVESTDPQLQKTAPKWIPEVTDYLLKN